MSEVSSAVAKPSITYIAENGTPVAGPAVAFGVEVGFNGASVTFGLPTEPDRLRMFAVFGMFTLASAAAKKSLAPVAEVDARFRQVSISPLAWGDEKPAKTPKTPKDPLAEMVDVIRAVKTAAGVPFDEAATRAKLADPEFRKKARRVPEVAAEFARRKTASPTTASGEGLAAL